MWANVTHTHTQPFCGPFAGTTWMSRCQKKSSGLCGARENIRGIHTNNPAGRRSVCWTNQRLASFVSPFSLEMPFLLQPSKFILAWDKHQICWLAYPVAWLWENIKQNIIWLCLYTSVWTACYMCMECWQRSYRSSPSHSVSLTTPVSLMSMLLWPPCIADVVIIFLSCGFFFFLSSFFFSSPNLSCRWLDVYHTSTHGVALVRI